jgi:hypothetical protein
VRRVGGVQINRLSIQEINRWTSRLGTTTESSQKRQNNLEVQRRPSAWNIPPHKSRFLGMVISDLSDALAGRQTDKTDALRPFGKAIPFK